jgi:choline dehydrogenase-like flavoprotein
MASFDYDVVIVGSGFGGSVAAFRTAEKGYRVGVMEAGKRWKDEAIPQTQWDVPRFLWLPAAELYGIQRMEYLDDVLILSGAGVGGGFARLWQHVVCPSEEVLRRARMGGDHGLGRRTGAMHRSGHPNARRRPLSLHGNRRGSCLAGCRDRDGERGNVQ